MYKLNNNGPKIGPWGTPLWILANSDSLIGYDIFCRWCLLDFPQILLSVESTNILWRADFRFLSKQLRNCYYRLGVLSMDGRSKSFDEAADGYVRAESICAVFLQKSKNARRVYSKVNKNSNFSLVPVQFWLVKHRWCTPKQTATDSKNTESRSRRAICRNSCFWTFTGSAKWTGRLWHFWKPTAPVSTENQRF